jgi:hypothetical protein
MKQSQRIYFPLAVYEATFADGSKARLSFGRRLKDGSPDADQGRRFVELLYCRDYPVPMNTTPELAADAAYLRKPPIVDGYVEFEGQRTRDPHFEPVSAKTAQTVSRVTPKQALRELVAAALSDPTVTPEALRPVFEQARRLAA